MACGISLGGSYQPSDEYGRHNISTPVRQALLTIRASIIQSRRASNKLKNAFVILSELGIFCFDSTNPEANASVLCWVLLDEPEWEQTDLVDHKLKKFALSIKTSLSRVELHFRDFNELDLWKKSIVNTQKFGRVKNMKPVARSQSNSIIQSQDHLVTAELMDSNPSITSNAKITVNTITVPNVSELTDSDDNVQDLEFFCKLVMGNAVYKTKTVSTSVTDKKYVKSNGRTTTFTLAQKEDDPNFTYTFERITTPNVLIVILYQLKKGKTNPVVRGVVNLDVECARSSGDIRDNFTPRPADIEHQPEKSLAVNVVMRTRYDTESLRKVTFGAPLNQIIERFVDNKKLMIPDVMYQCLAFLWKHSLKTTGVFRVSGNKNRMRSYVTELDRSPNGTLPLMKYEDEHTVAGIMKLYLRELPEPLITFNHYETMLHCGGAPKDIMKKTNNPMDALNAIKQFASSAATKDLEQPPLDDTLEQLRKLTQELPPSHYMLLKYTCHLLHCITHHSDVNFMKPTNLAIVFGPVFASPSSDMDISKQEMLTGHLPYLSRSTEIMIVNWAEVFPNSRGILELIECNNNFDVYSKAKQEGKFNTSNNAAVDSVVNTVDKPVEPVSHEPSSNNTPDADPAAATVYDE